MADTPLRDRLLGIFMGKSGGLVNVQNHPGDDSYIKVEFQLVPGGAWYNFSISRKQAFELGQVLVRAGAVLEKSSGAARRSSSARRKTSVE